MLMEAQTRVDVLRRSRLNSASDGVDGQHHAAANPPENSPDTQCTGGWMGPWECLVGCGEEETSFPLPVFETRTFERVASPYAITSFIRCFSFVERSEKVSLPSCQKVNLCQA